MIFRKTKSSAVATGANSSWSHASFDSTTRGCDAPEPEPRPATKVASSARCHRWPAGPPKTRPKVARRRLRATSKGRPVVCWARRSPRTPPIGRGRGGSERVGKVERKRSERKEKSGGRASVMREREEKMPLTDEARHALGEHRPVRKGVHVYPRNRLHRERAAQREGGRRSLLLLRRGRVRMPRGRRRRRRPRRDLSGRDRAHRDWEASPWRAGSSEAAEGPDHSRRRYREREGEGDERER